MQQLEARASLPMIRTGSEDQRRRRAVIATGASRSPAAAQDEARPEGFAFVLLELTEAIEEQEAAAHRESEAARTAPMYEPNERVPPACEDRREPPATARSAA